MKYKFKFTAEDGRSLTLNYKNQKEADKEAKRLSKGVFFGLSVKAVQLSKYPSFDD